MEKNDSSSSNCLPWGSSCLRTESAFLPPDQTILETKESTAALLSFMEKKKGEWEKVAVGRDGGV